MEQSIEVFALPPLPEVSAGDDLARLILDASSGSPLEPGDVLVVAQKVVSKAENALVDLATVRPSAFARSIAEPAERDARVVEVVLQQSRRIVKMERGILIAETHHGFVCANAGVDASNVPGGEFVTVLPEDPDASARALRAALEEEVGGPLGVIISDSFNRPWREGSMNVAIGVSGLPPVRDMRGEEDDHGRVLKSTLVAIADEVASAAQLVMSETGRHPVAVVRGLEFEASDDGAVALLRDPARDLFR